LNTCADAHPVTGLDLSGSCYLDTPLGHEEYNWHLSGISCGAGEDASPQGTCGGAVAGLPNP
jgi:hypothetical protein